MAMASLRSALVVAAFMALFVASQAAHVPGKNVAKVDIAQIEKAMEDPVVVIQEIACILGTGRCDRLGRDIKRAIPEVLLNECASCTPEQAASAKKLTDFIESNYPGILPQIKAKYDSKKHGKATPSDAAGAGESEDAAASDDTAQLD